ncbi:MAG TPA: DnaJ domain-containing protein [Polyangiaceae bacterium]
MATHSHSRLPKLVEGVDLRALPIGPAEAFVLSRVDAQASEADIAEATGIPLESVAKTLEELCVLGAVRFEEPERESRNPRKPSRPSGAFRIGPIVEASRPQETHHPAAALYDPNELLEAADLDDARKRTILETYYKLDHTTHYELLRVEPSADKRAIKSAYYEIVNLFHPDRYFGKNLGTFKAKLEQVFSRVTEAHDVLTRGAAREEYDAYLASRRKTSELFSVSESALQAEADAIRKKIEDDARALSAPPIAPASSLHPEPRIVDASPNSQRVSVRPLDPDERKRALARKLGRSFSPSPTPRPSVPAISKVEAQGHAVDELKRRYEQRITQGKQQHVDRYLETAQQALATHDPVAASNALRIAESLAPDEPAQTGRLQDLKEQAGGLVANHYLQLAQYEEREGKFADAAASYQRVAQAKPTARIHERAAYCGLMAERELRSAGEHARRAVALAPEDAQCRVTLARIYVAAGMKQSGLAEFERAAQLAPKDDTIKEWIRRLKRGEA